MQGPDAARIGELLEGGVAIMVATRDEGLQTHVTRGWGGHFDAEHRQLAVALNVSPDSDVIRDLEANGAIAVTLADPTTYQAVQLTGCVEWVGEPRSSRSTIEAEGSVLNPLGTFTGRLASCRDLSEATLTCLDLLDDLFGFAHSMLLIADNENQQLFAVATHGYDAAHVGAEIAMGEGFIGVAAQRREMVRITSMARNRAMAAAVSRDEAQGLPLRGLDDAQSVLAAPVMLGDRLVGVLYLDSSVPGTFDSRQAELIDIIARHLALTIAFLESDGPDDLVEGTTTSTSSGHSPTSSPASPTPDTVRVSFHERDGSIFIDSEYLIRGVAGRILYRLLAEHADSGRTQFSNKELRLDRSLGLPAGADNLEARLLVLRRRLTERGGPIGLERVGRGRLELTVACPIDLGFHPDTTS